MTKKRGKITDIGVYESNKGFWELIRGWKSDDKDEIGLGEAKDEYELLFVKGDDYGPDDKTIVINGEQLKDLIKFLKQF